MAEEPIHQRIARERKAALPQAPLLREYRRYARGKHRGTLTADQQRILKGVTGHDFADNVCRRVIEAAATRMQLVRFEVANSTVLGWLHDFWVTTNLASFSGDVHYATLRDGDHAVSLTWDGDATGRVRLVREKWWDGRSGMFVAYDDLGQPTYAVKEWTNGDGKKRRVVYWPDRIDRYIMDGAGWQGYTPPGETNWSATWKDKNGNPIGIPVVHFRDTRQPADDSDGEVDSNYGMSELAGGVLGLQDEINDIQRDITAAARYSGYGMLYATKFTPDTDSNNKPIPIRVEPGGFMYNKEAGTFGTIPPGDLGQLEKALMIKHSTVSRMTATPLHEITGGDWPSGEALLRADQPLVEKVTTLDAGFGPQWASVAHKATQIANAFSQAGLDTDAMISAVFAPPDRRDPLTLATIASIVAPFVSPQEVLRILNYSPDRIALIIKEMDEAKAKAMSLALQDLPTSDGQGNGDKQA